LGQQHFLRHGAFGRSAVLALFIQMSFGQKVGPALQQLAAVDAICTFDDLSE
jgi:hypothetical protein